MTTFPKGRADLTLTRAEACLLAWWLERKAERTGPETRALLQRLAKALKAGETIHSSPPIMIDEER